MTLLPLVWRRLPSTTRIEVWGGGLAGLVLFAASAFQQMSLQFTTAGKAGFITGLYVVLVPLILALGWQQCPHWSAWMASALAAVGLFLLSVVEPMTLAPGDGLELAGAAKFALHVIVIGKLANRGDVLRLAWAQYFVCGVLSLIAGLVLEAHTLSGFAVAWWAVVYTGVLSIGLAYTLQIVGQRHAPPADAAIILSSEAVFAALSGGLLLNETLTAQQLLGCGLMLAGMLLAQAHRMPDDQSSGLFGP
jgi:drug/metabolite transporter (DMT)-like permease